MSCETVRRLSGYLSCASDSGHKEFSLETHRESRVKKKIHSLGIILLLSKTIKEESQWRI
jgi:hypothetical protein